MKKNKPIEPTQGQIDARLKAKVTLAKSLLEGERERVALTAPEWKEIDHWATTRGIGDRLESGNSWRLVLRHQQKSSKPPKNQPPLCWRAKRDCARTRGKANFSDGR